MTEATTNATQDLFVRIGKSLPDIHRSEGTQLTRINIEPTGMLKVAHTLDKYAKGKVDETKDNLEGKKLVLFLGKESHPLTRKFHTPKLAMIYDFMMKERDDVEFLYVSLDGTKEEYDRFTATHPWPCIAWEDTETRAVLEASYYTPLHKAHGICAIVVLDPSHAAVVNRDAEPRMAQTHCETGKDFPWVDSPAENCCACVAGLLMCTIM